MCQADDVAVDLRLTVEDQERHHEHRPTIIHREQDHHPAVTMPEATIDLEMYGLDRLTEIMGLAMTDIMEGQGHRH